jgi:hypothetical protein
MNISNIIFEDDMTRGVPESEIFEPRKRRKITKKEEFKLAQS